jgi:hypothetical protein
MRRNAWKSYMIENNDFFEDVTYVKQVVLLKEWSAMIWCQLYELSWKKHL